MSLGLGDALDERPVTDVQVSGEARVRREALAALQTLEQPVVAVITWSQRIAFTAGFRIRFLLATYN